MSKTYKDRPEKYNKLKTKQDRRFESSKGRNLKKSKELINEFFNSPHKDAP